MTSPLSRRLSRPPAAICAKPASRPRKLQLSRELAEKNIRLSRRETCGLNTEKSIANLFSPVISQSQRLLRHPSSALSCFLCVYAYSAARGEFLVPSARLAIMQRRAFSVVGPSAWNDLPFELCSLLMADPSKFYISVKSFFFCP